VRVEHQPGAIRELLSMFPEGTPVALESVGNWYWIVDEINTAGCKPLMAPAAKAKVMMGNVNKTDKLDTRGLATLLRMTHCQPSGLLHLRYAMSVSCPEPGGIMQDTSIDQESDPCYLGQVQPFHRR
jgi:hypothetical protein